MTGLSNDLDRLLRQGRQVLDRVRPRHLAVVAGVAAVGLAMVAVTAMARPGPRAPDAGERLQIEVVPPVEPVVAPGPVMEVGYLVDGPISIPSARPVVESAYDAPYDAFDEELKPPPAAKPRYRDDPVRPPVQPRERTVDRRRGGVSRWLGFDGPERDYQAEREARRERMDRPSERDPDIREVRRYRSDGVPDGPPEYRRRGDEGLPYRRD